MVPDHYTYILGIPINLMSVLWATMSAVLITTYAVNHLVNAGGVVGSMSKYLTDYGKASTTVRSLDVPKSYFTHYYILASIWNTVCFITISRICFGLMTNNWIASLFLMHSTANASGDKLSLLLCMLMLTVHSMKRLYECLFISVFSNKTKMGIIQYVWGNTYYILLAPTMISECLPLHKLPFGSFQVRHFMGIVVFLIASFYHHQSHIILADLRKKGSIKKDAHGIPQGGLFNLVSCPHYFAEVLVYISITIILGAQCQTWFLVLLYNIFAHANMAMGAHTWYRNTFKNYPPNRKAFIPFVL
uniref:Polyprenal reductase n=1 Tax=Ciona intestinalis TaxID=7719 RepID=F6T4U7_CIOIN|nr:polyprenol reductase [Ciona intestinalis]|eukprot:XP_002129419.1 polyprenol reductase [Ciona intestinalis]